MFTSVGYLERIVRAVVEKIEHELGGGNARVGNDTDNKMVTITWKKNPTTVQVAQFQKTYSYQEFEQLADPDLIAKDFVGAYKAGEKPKIELLEAAKAELVISEVVKTEPVKPKTAKVAKSKSTKVVPDKKS